jgi:hypothetical protein
MKSKAIAEFRRAGSARTLTQNSVACPDGTTDHILLVDAEVSMIMQARAALQWENTVYDSSCNGAGCFWSRTTKRSRSSRKMSAGSLL